MTRASDEAVKAILADFEVHRDRFLTRLRGRRPGDYARLVERLTAARKAVTDEEEEEDFINWSPMEQSSACDKARRTLAANRDPQDMLIELNLILRGDW